MARLVGILALGVLVGVVAVAGSAAAQTERNLGEILDPFFRGADNGMTEIGETAPGAAPFVDVGRDGVRLVRDAAYTVVIGLRGGEAGTETGTPDALVVRVPGAVLVDGVAVPATGVEVPARVVDVSTPGVVVAREIPAFVVPAGAVEVPGVRVPLVVPGVATPPLEIVVPPYALSTPPVATPPVAVGTPGATLPGDDATVEYGDLGAGFGGARGTVYAGPVVVPYEVPATRVTLDDVLPQGVPRSATVERGALADVPAQTVHEEPGHEVLPSQTVETPGASQRVEGQRVSEPVAAGEAAATPTRVETPERRLTERERMEASVPGQRVGEVETPGASAGTERVEVADERVETPGAGVEREAPVPADDFGYFGYGRGSDSSLYPYACAARVCVDATPLVRPYVWLLDSRLEALAALLDGDVVVVFPPMTPGPREG